MQRAKILHIVGDRKVGGIGSTIDLLQASPLANAYEFCDLESDGHPRDLLRIARAATAVDAVAIHFSVRTANLPTFAWLRLLSKLYGFKIALIEHHYSERFQAIGARRPQQLGRALAIAASLVDRTIAVSPTQSQWLAGFVPAAKLSIVASCSPLDSFLALPEQSSRSGPLKLVSFGRHTLPWKGFDVLIAAAKLLQDLPLQIEIGGSGPAIEQLRQLAAETDNVKIVGFVPDLGAFLQAADAVVIPSRWEAWGLTCTEAKAAGKPVVVSHVDGLIDQVGGCGLSVPPDSPAALAAALRLLCQARDSGQLQAWGRAARASVQTAEAEYLSSWEALLSDLTDRAEGKRSRQAATSGYSARSRDEIERTRALQSYRARANRDFG